MWKELIEEFIIFLKLEKSLSHNTIESYSRDIKHFVNFCELKYKDITVDLIELNHLSEFIKWLNEMGMSTRSQARVVSGLKAFFKFLIFEDIITENPSDLLEAPRIGRKLPEVLNIHEIDQIEAAIDLSKAEGHRNKAIIETLYSCGLRVSELVNLKISNLHFDLGFIKVSGKGKKERLIPISQKAIDEIDYYKNNYRNTLKIKAEFSDILFLNRRGRKLTRVMIFTIVKELVKLTEIKINVSPHTFRHSFATHMMEGGADLRAIQEMLGHESIITTEIYTHLDTAYLKQIVTDCHPRSLKNF